MNKKIIGFIAAIVFAPFATAQANWYGAVGLSSLDYEEEGLSQTATVSTINGAVGIEFNPNFTGELRIGFGMSGDSINVTAFDQNVNVDFDLDQFYGLYLRPQFKGERVQVYGLLGYASAEVTANAEGFEVSDDDADVSFGAGAGYLFNERMSLNLEYTSFSADAFDLSGIGVRFEFGF